jgi:hypothetical protein
MTDEGRPQDPVAEPDEPDQPLRGPAWAKRELLEDGGRDDESSGVPGQNVADEDRRRTPEPADITDHAP